MLAQAVTTVWRTELGTTLLDGFNSTTDGSAYFHYLCSYQSASNPASTQVPLRYGPAAPGRFACGEPAASGRASVFCWLVRASGVGGTLPPRLFPWGKRERGIKFLVPQAISPHPSESGKVSFYTAPDFQSRGNPRLIAPLPFALSLSLDRLRASWGPQI